MQFFVEGIPRPQGSKRGFVRKGRVVLVEVSKHLAPWRERVAAAAAAHTQDGELIGPVVVELEFVMPRPKAMSARMPTPWHVKRPDVDKLTRAVLDALTGSCFVDDSQVVAINARKRTAEPLEPVGVYVWCSSAQKWLHGKNKAGYGDMVTQ